MLSSRTKIFRISLFENVNIHLKIYEDLRNVGFKFSIISYLSVSSVIGKLYKKIQNFLISAVDDLVQLYTIQLEIDKF